jgi:iron complex transport system substrate-binding protein
MWKICCLSLGLLLAACTPRPAAMQRVANPTQTDCLPLTHGAGNTQVCGPAQRVAVLNPKMLDIVLSLGLEPVGYAEVFSNHQGDFNQPGRQIPYLGSRLTQPMANLGTSGNPALESLVRLKPDLILGDIWGNQDEYGLLSAIAPTLLFEYVGANKWQQPLQVTAQALGRPERAQAVLQAYRIDVQASRQVLAPVVQHYPKVLMLSIEQMSQQMYVVTPADFCGNLVTEMGFQLVSLNSQVSADSIAAPITPEMLPQLDADLIIILTADSNKLRQTQDMQAFEAEQLRTTRQSWQTHPLSQRLPATRAQRVYFLSNYLCLGMPSPIGAKLVLQRLKQQLLPLR